MSTDFNCKTQLVEDKNTPYKKAPLRSVITDGLSEEAISYVNQAVSRTTENGYNIFDQNGLMPNSYDFFEKLLEKNVLQVCDFTEEGTIYTADERFLIETNKDGTRTVHYDSDGLNGYDRTVTYKDTPIGNLKIKETFNADGDKINEVEIEREVKTAKKIDSRIVEKENTDYTLWDKFLKFIGCDVQKKTREWETTEKAVIKELQTQIGVNADDLGYDKEGGNHFEYMEKYIEKDNRSYCEYQLYRDWRYADKNEYEDTYKRKS